MGEILLIVESPRKARTIRAFLGDGYHIQATLGHIRDLPVHHLGVDVEHEFRLQYDILETKANVVQEICRAAQRAERVVLATDPDREGESIAWHIAEILRAHKIRAPISRAMFHEITAEAVRSALKQTRPINMPLVQAQQARRAIDRLFGYQLSRWLWSALKHQGALSAGRVQSVALRMVAERHAEREQFKCEDYWLIDVELVGPQPSTPADRCSPPAFWARLKRADDLLIRLTSQALAEQVSQRLSAAAYVVSAFRQTIQSQPPPPPFITSTLQQEANRLFRFPVSRTMQIAQALYEGVDIDGKRVGLITYMRTDSPMLSQSAMTRIRSWIVEHLGEGYLSPQARQYHAKQPNAQEAHEAIRPTDIYRTPQMMRPFLDHEQWALYTLIWARALACQMSDAQYHIRQMDILATPPPTARHIAPTLTAPSHHTSVPDRGAPSSHPKQVRAKQTAADTTGAEQTVTDSHDFIANARQYTLQALSRQIHFEGFLRARALSGLDDLLNAQGTEKTKKRAGRVKLSDKAAFESVDEDERSEQDAADASLPENKFLPAYQSGTPLTHQSIQVLHKQTQPPPLFTEAALVRALERAGVGRPSTYAQIIDTLFRREYVTRAKRHLDITPLGETVNQALTSRFDQYINIAFTAHIEDQLDAIAHNKCTYLDVMGQFYQSWREALSHHAQEQGAKSQSKSSTSSAPASTSPHNATPDADTRRNRIERKQSNLTGSNLTGSPGDSVAQNPNSSVYNNPELDHRANSTSPARSGASPDTSTPARSRAQTCNSESLLCPQCGKPLVKRSGRFGEFLGCSAFPRCQFSMALPENGVSCPRCAHSVVRLFSKKHQKFFFKCTNTHCNFMWWTDSTPKSHNTRNERRR